MENNVFDKLDELHHKIEAIAPDEDAMSDEEKIEFVKTANRIFCYDGQVVQFENRVKKQKKQQIANIVALTLCSVILLIEAFRTDIVPYIIAIALTIAANFANIALLCIILKLNHPKVEIPYEEFFEKWMSYQYDANGIICESREKLSVQILRWSVILLNYALGFVGTVIDLVVGIVTIVFVSILVFVMFRRTRLSYVLWFCKDKQAIPYCELSQFMYEHKLK